jgi:hypothetical protein
MGTQKSPLPFQVVQNDDGADVFETQSGHGYLYHHPVKAAKHTRPSRPQGIY